jgi:hypothetical protein
MPPEPKANASAAADQTTAPFVEKQRCCGKPLADGFNIDHHNIWY